MKKVEINGVAKVYGTKNADNSYARIEINGIRIESMLADHILEDAPEGELYIDKAAICKVNITIEPYPEMLNVNGKEMVLEL